MPLLMNLFFMKNEFSFTKILLISVLLMVLFVHIFGIRKLSSVIYAIINELRLSPKVAMWYSKIFFLDNVARYEIAMKDTNTKAQPTPYKVNSLVLPFVYIDKPEDIKIVLNAADTLEKADLYKFADKFFGDTLLTVKVPIWKLHRRASSPTFSSHYHEKYSHSMNKWSKWVLQVLQTKADTDEIIDLWDPISLQALNLTLETFMGIDPNTVYTTSEKRKFISHCERLTKYFGHRFLRIWLHFSMISNIVYGLNGTFRIIRECMDLISKTVCDRQRILKEKGEDEKIEAGSVLLDTLYNLHPPARGEAISESLKREVFFFSEAAFETSALTNCYTLLMLAMNPSIQDQVYQEINEILGEKDEELITVDDVENMLLLDRCIKETLRLFPPLPNIGRTPTINIKLSNGEVAEKGTNIIMVPYLIHRRPELYENPLVWNPDNFLPEAVQKRHPYSYIPFSAGPRGCIGAKYGMLSMKILVSTILRKYRITTDMIMGDVRHDVDLLLRCSNGWKVKLHTRAGYNRSIDV